MLVRLQEAQVVRKKQIILKFVQGTQGVAEKTVEVGIRPPTRSFGDIGRNRNAGSWKLNPIRTEAPQSDQVGTL